MSSSLHKPKPEGGRREGKIDNCSDGATKRGGGGKKRNRKKIGYPGKTESPADMNPPLRILIWTSLNSLEKTPDG